MPRRRNSDRSVPPGEGKLPGPFTGGRTGGKKKKKRTKKKERKEKKKVGNRVEAEKKE